MSDDLYQVLGVARSASQKEIRQAYRKLAKENHPDLNPGDKAAEEKFKALSAAFAILGDEEQKGRYDRGEIDASGQEKVPEGAYRHYAEGAAGQSYRSRAGFADFADLGDVFSDLFGQAGRRQGKAEKPARGQDVRYQLDIGFLDAVKGAKKRITMPDGKALDVTIPPGLRDGQTLRLKGHGAEGPRPGTAGDALVEISVGEHPTFKRDGYDIHIDLPITIDEAVLGAKVSVPTCHGSVSLNLPKGSSSGRKLRLKGKGVPKGKSKESGDQYVTLKVMLPEKPNADLEEAIKKWAASHSYDVRKGLG